MAEYLVTYAVTIEADTAEDAANKVRYEGIELHWADLQVQECAYGIPIGDPETY